MVVFVSSGNRHLTDLMSLLMLSIYIWLCFAGSLLCISTGNLALLA